MPEMSSRKKKTCFFRDSFCLLRVEVDQAQVFQARSLSFLHEPEASSSFYGCQTKTGLLKFHGFLWCNQVLNKKFGLKRLFKN